MKKLYDKAFEVLVKETKKFIRIRVNRKQSNSEGRVATLIINKTFKDGDAVNDWEFEGLLTSTDYDKGRIIVTGKDEKDNNICLDDEEYYAGEDD